MNFAVSKSFLFFLIVSCACLSSARLLSAQEEPQAPLEDKPKPAGVSSNPIPPINEGDQQDESNGMTPDITPLTGVQNPTLGSPEVRHNYWQPGIQWSGVVQSNSYNQTPGSSWVMNNFIAATLSLLKASSHSQLAVNYSAGGFISSDSSQGNGYYQQLALTQTFQWGRSLVQLLDQFSYLPQSSFGFGGGTGLSLPGTGGSIGPVIPGMGSSVPDQSIFSATGSRYSNTAVVQLTYAITRRGSITASGSYGLLHFVEPGNVDNDVITGTIGYNYVLTRADTIGAFYRFSAVHFSGEPQAYGDHSANLAYSRKLTGHLALQLYGGPAFTASRTVTTGTSGTTVASTTHGANAGMSFTYALKRGGVSVNYSHGIYGGSGVLTGSTADLISFNAFRRLGRIWSGQLNGGYGHNSPLANGAQMSPGSSYNSSYNTWNVGGGASRALGRNTTLNIAYNTTLTDYGLAGCVGAACSGNQMFQYVTVSFQWFTRPFVLP